MKAAAAPSSFSIASLELDHKFAQLCVTPFEPVEAWLSSFWWDCLNWPEWSIRYLNREYKVMIRDALRLGAADLKVTQTRLTPCRSVGNASSCAPTPLHKFDSEFFVFFFFLGSVFHFKTDSQLYVVCMFGACARVCVLLLTHSSLCVSVRPNSSTLKLFFLLTSSPPPPSGKPTYYTRSLWNPLASGIRLGLRHH